MSGTAGSAPAKGATLSGVQMALAAGAIGLGNFLVVLDTTIANVSVPTIAGSLGVSSEQGTWVITSYAVAEAITVPLTGWLAARFGAQRTFLACYFGFAVLSLLCGLSQSLPMLIVCRVLLGLCGGPIMPLAQTLLMRILPPEKQTMGTVMWAMTTLVGPIVGPVLGGTLCDNAGWQWIFFVGVPLALAGGTVLLGILRTLPDPTQKARIDGVGLGLLVVWVGALQILLDEGRNKDWFASTEIVVLAIVAVIGFAAFMIWELTEKHPIVNLRVFRHRGFTAATLTYSLGFAAFFSNIVIL
ncbi:MAG TPA: DHA2 family efflux MFS transporter permease subunit, partial [Novosphingobium sp.]|nr:DHA2 family efflux MFS transporter permease subunit [Novosphingobium sp.]